MRWLEIPLDLSYHSRRIFFHVFCAETQHDPTFATQRAVNLTIALHISFYFLAPKTFELRQSGVVTAVPKVAIQKYRDLLFYKSDVGFTFHAAIVFPVTIAFGVKRRTQQIKELELKGGIARLD